MGQYTYWEIFIITLLVVIVLGAGRIPHLVGRLFRLKPKASPNEIRNRNSSEFNNKKG
jgi:Sec-independent protein translocase protein TatA